ncbi:DUF2157 domain-containing protein [Nocardia sp. CA-084685]|uniref:DUF2157 domain-containing protein n=1 Tax=Nocardia sp. CA-084685 TaxID=3239970 RepID=UPI003D976A3F
MGIRDRSGAALGRLVDEGVLTEAQRDAVVRALVAEKTKPDSPGKLLAEIAAYIGAGLMLGALVLLVASSWNDLQRAGRVLIFGLVSLGLALGAIALAGGVSALFARTALPHSSRVRLATVLFALTSGAAAVTVGSAIDADNTWVYACVAGLVVAALGYSALPSIIGLFAVAGYSVVLVPGVLDEVFGVEEVWVGLGLLALGAVWFALTRLGAFVETWAGYLVALLVSAAGIVTVDVDRREGFVLAVAVALVCFVLHATQRSAVLMIGGAAMIALAVGLAVAHWFDGAVGAMVAILLIGTVVLALGAWLLARSSKSSA